jgi:hypothetical protein
MKTETAPTVLADGHTTGEKRRISDQIRAVSLENGKCCALVERSGGNEPFVQSK